MRAHAGGNLAAFLMFAILLAVPFLAIFGIPEFVPASVSPFDEQEFDDQGIEELNFPAPPNHLEDAPVFSASESSDQFISAREMPGARYSEEFEHSSPGSLKDPFLRVEQKLSRPMPSKGLAGWELASGRMTDSEIVDPFISRASYEERDTTHSGQSFLGDSIVESTAYEPGKEVSSQVRQTHEKKTSLTWNSAVRRLHAQGIRNFRLEPGSRSDLFYFYCFFVSPKNPRVTHRFEAEAADPLHAVKLVLDQIERWSGNE